MVTLMSDTLNSLNNIRTLRANARELDLAALEEMLEKLSVVVSERREEAQASEAANREKAEKLAKYRELLLQEGIDPNELLNGMPTAPAVKKNARLVLLNISTPTKMVRLSSGLARAVPHLLLNLPLMQVNRWMIS